ncbi:methionine/alanine import family NSS transporter small subunit [Aquibacillus sp. 3ASR75-11]|uniref:Methionine/alanine import family NSS transporter small subunit n=1 Tax=Terrihalobacillus insolitus TaxID=2950438 RepID=A0A9X3WT51_9BACI|nr:methionine/alanine import family NSS transporter small subunit [Terrihalobacillus insolitus]MDC3412353.1 methionine/alanine import family NSS transporter small subunit [Terrihalobacillus insolitus]MDC3422954.1 methionine/alanine import family NSS transporter small subunit [Terrihalobacillus insolitus]
MSGGAITMGLIGVIIIWGGLIASILHARKTSKSK